MEAGLTCEDLQADLCESRQRSLVEHTDAADLLHLGGVDASAPDRPENVPNRSRFLKRTLEETWHGGKKTHSRNSASCQLPPVEEEHGKNPSHGRGGGAAAQSNVLLWDKLGKSQHWVFGEAQRPVQITTVLVSTSQPRSALVAFSDCVTEFYEDMDGVM